MSRASDRAYDHIRNMILSGELSPGEQIREEALAELCGVSRTPVRDALRRLEAELFIRRNESQRSFVADWSLDDLEEAFQLRAMLEAYAARRAAKRISWDQLARLRSHNDAIHHAITAPTPDIPKFLDHNRQFHAIVLEAAGSGRLAGMLAQVIEQPVVLRTAKQYDMENLKRSHHEHDELLIAFDNRDGEWAAAVMTGHIRRAFHVYAAAHSGDADIRRTDEAA
ncbi:GntR family transcriptional regulator [Sphingorhabdus contaminans]|jgi:DNA-binding GntR family transcriptional regulator|uniref:GntR family transcriptional regulator n=1 Tax=Sphingorhabdus contaminans TaxID=1343899 RepID=A0A553WAI5_9SPHN|nr:GntR family transcriptional regulator [Sphingorhabdus contaminans]TSB01707.1 GntR family transcriptional regulator [Sphingorhabdus contaminans]